MSQINLQYRLKRKSGHMLNRSAHGEVGLDRSTHGGVGWASRSELRAVVTTVYTSISSTCFSSAVPVPATSCFPRIQLPSFELAAAVAATAAAVAGCAVASKRLLEVGDIVRGKNVFGFPHFEHPLHFATVVVIANRSKHPQCRRKDVTKRRGKRFRDSFGVLHDIIGNVKKCDSSLLVIFRLILFPPHPHTFLHMCLVVSDPF